MNQRKNQPMKMDALVAEWKENLHPKHPLKEKKKKPHPGKNEALKNFRTPKKRTANAKIDKRS